MDPRHLETFPCPGFKAYMEQQQTILELFFSVNQSNYLEVLNKFTPFINGIQTNDNTFFQDFTICVKNNPTNAYYIAYVFYHVYTQLNINQGTGIRFEKWYDPLETTYGVVFGLFTKDQYKSKINQMYDNEQSLYKSLLAISTFFDIGELMSIAIQINSKYETKNEFVEFLENYYYDIVHIIKHEKFEPKEDDNDVFILIYNDNVEKFTEYLNNKLNDPMEKNPFHFKESKYKLIGYYYSFPENPELIYVATLFKAYKIINYLLEVQQPSSQIFDCASLAASSSDFECLKLFADKITLPSSVFIDSLSQPNLEIINFLYEKTGFWPGLNIPNNGKFYLFPHSCFFIVNHMPSLRTLPFYLSDILWGISTACTWFFSMDSEPEETHYDYFATPFGLEIYEYVLKQTRSYYWVQFYNAFTNQNRVAEILIDTFKPITPRVFREFQKHIYQLQSFLNIMRSPEFKVSCYDVKRIGISLAFEIALSDNVQLFDLMIEKGYDVNNTKHPDKASLIHYACLSKSVQILQHLLAVPGLDINRKDGYGRTAIDIARVPEYRKLLINAGCRSGRSNLLYNKRDFINCNPILFKDSFNGPSNHTFAGRNEIFSCTIQPLTTISGSLVYASPDVRYNIVSHGNDRCEIGTKSVPIPTGPYNFGVITESYYYEDKSYVIRTGNSKLYTPPKNADLQFN